MEIKTYDTILNELCNDFDNLIAPKFIARANTNIIYLLLKSIAKGMEIVHNTTIALSNKFNPEKCSDEDLVSVAKLVGTRFLEGSSSGLEINIRNNSGKPAILKSGSYTYKLDEDSIFNFSITVDISLENETSYTVIAMSTERRAIPVTSQSSIKLIGRTLEGTLIDLSDFDISCLDNKGLQGTTPETNLEFRNRVLRGYSTASIFDRMREEIANLPYIFDCQILFNNSSSPLTVDTLTPETPVVIPSYHLLLILDGAPDEKVAEIVASYGTYETANIDKLDKIINYYNDVFIDGTYKVHYIEPLEYTYSLTIYYEADPRSISTSTVTKSITDALEKYKHANTYTPLLTERNFSNYLVSLGLPSVQILNVDLVDDIDSETVKDYIKIPKTRIAKLNNIVLNNMTEV